VFDQSTMERVAVNRATFQGRWSEEIAFRPSLEALDRYPHRLAAARDFTSVDRILVVGEPSDRGLAMAEAIARRWPTARVTLLPCPSVPHDRLPALLAAGVEVPDVPGDEDWGSWLDGRRFHYSVVVRGGLPSPCLDAALARSQPQAMVMLDLSGQAGLPAPDALVVAVRTADVVLCASDADRLLVAAAAPGATALVLPQVPGALEGGRGVGDPLVEAMAHVGLAPPPAALERWRPRPERAPSRSR
jgi:hypothetical protein